MLRFIVFADAPFPSSIRYFNTSHVKVYLCPLSRNASAGKDFNTSHVKVYRNIGSACVAAPKNFNTSHVKVYQDPGNRNRIRSLISIHLMLRFILPYYRIHGSCLISIHLMLRFILDADTIKKQVAEFQYISC